MSNHIFDSTIIAKVLQRVYIKELKKQKKLLILAKKGYPEAVQRLREQYSCKVYTEDELIEYKKALDF
jgi:hypothetical protein